jgi:hypothetical protein
MIWIVLLGVILTSVFFFFALRLNMNALIQRQATEELNKRAFFESYVGYLMENPSEINSQEFEGVTVTLTQEVEEIRGVLDVDQEIEYPIDKAVKVEWNLCSKNYKMPIEIGEDRYEHATDPSCSTSSPGYDDMQDLTVSNSLKLKAIGAPTHYRITPQSPNDTVTDNKWHLTAEMDLGRWKKVRRVEVFGG